MQRKKFKQNKKSGNYQHFIKIDISNNGNWNVNTVVLPNLFSC